MQHIIRDIGQIFAITLVRYFSIAGIAFLLFYKVLAVRYKNSKIQARQAGTIEAMLEGAVVIVLAFVMPLHPVTILLFTFVSFFINVYGHLGYEIMPRGLRHSIWFEIINTSLYHNLHHRKFKGNYSLYFRFWDRFHRPHIDGIHAFGTFSIQFRSSSL